MFNCKISFSEFKERFSNAKNLSKYACINVHSFETPFYKYEFIYYLESGELVLSNSSENLAWYKTGCKGYDFATNEILGDMYNFFITQYEYAVTQDVDKYNSDTIENCMSNPNDMECEVYSYEGNSFRVEFENLVNLGFVCNLYNDTDDKIAMTKMTNPIKMFRWVQGEMEYYEEMGEEVDSEIDY